MKSSFEGENSNLNIVANIISASHSAQHAHSKLNSSNNTHSREASSGSREAKLASSLTSLINEVMILKISSQFSALTLTP
jgi:hypothetical protein